MAIYSSVRNIVELFDETDVRSIGVRTIHENFERQHAECFAVAVADKNGKISEVHPRPEKRRKVDSQALRRAAVAKMQAAYAADDAFECDYNPDILAFAFDHMEINLERT